MRAEPALEGERNCSVKIDARKIAPTLLKIVISVFFIWFVLHRIDLSVLKGYLTGADPVNIVLAFCTLVAGGFAGAASWFTVLRSNGYSLSYPKVCTVHWCGMFFNSFLPSNVGGDLYKGYLLVKNSKEGAARAASTILLDRIINFSVLALTGIFAFCFAFGFFKSAAATAVTVLICFGIVRLLASKCDAISGNRIVEFLLSLIRFSKDHKNCVLALAGAVVSQGCKIGCHIFLIRALGLDLDTGSVWYIIPLFGFISALPVSLGGIGLREGVAIWVAEPLSMAQEELVALSLVSQLLFVSVNCLGFIPFMMLRHRLRK